MMEKTMRLSTSISQNLSLSAISREEEVDWRRGKERRGGGGEYNNVSGSRKREEMDWMLVVGVISSLQHSDHLICLSVQRKDYKERKRRNDLIITLLQQQQFLPVFSPPFLPFRILFFCICANGRKGGEKTGRNCCCCSSVMIKSFLLFLSL